MTRLAIITIKPTKLCYANAKLRGALNLYATSPLLVSYWSVDAPAPSVPRDDLKSVFAKADIVERIGVEVDAAALDPHTSLHLGSITSNR